MFGCKDRATDELWPVGLRRRRGTWKAGEGRCLLVWDLSALRVVLLAACVFEL